MKAGRGNTSFSLLFCFLIPVQQAASVLSEHSDILVLPPGASLIYKRLRCGSPFFRAQVLNRPLAPGLEPGNQLIRAVIYARVY
jgi:hypothetical protein